MPHGGEALGALKYDKSPEGTPPPVRLLGATPLPNDLLEVRCKPGVAEGWQLDDLSSRAPLGGDGDRARTTTALHSRLVFIVDQDGNPLSNRHAQLGVCVYPRTNRDWQHDQ